MSGGEDAKGERLFRGLQSASLTGSLPIRDGFPHLASAALFFHAAHQDCEAGTVAVRPHQLWQCRSTVGVVPSTQSHKILLAFTILLLLNSRIFSRDILLFIDKDKWVFLPMAHPRPALAMGRNMNRPKPAPCVKYRIL